MGLVALGQFFSLDPTFFFKRCLVTFMSSATLGRFRPDFSFLFPSPRMRSSFSKSVAGSGCRV